MIQQATLFNITSIDSDLICTGKKYAEYQNKITLWKCLLCLKWLEPRTLTVKINVNVRVLKLSYINEISKG